jgi:hypothetical protein
MPLSDKRSQIGILGCVPIAPAHLRACTKAGRAENSNSDVMVTKSANQLDFG